MAESARSFLKEVSRRGQGRVDLVIVGDFLEMWQPPPSIPCKGTSADLGCTLDEMEALSRLVVAAHSDAMSVLRTFAEAGENRLHIVPGNHDAALRYERIWRPLGEALNAAGGRINLVESGIWVSPDESIVAEHGHQIGMDVNRYEKWPSVARRQGQAQYIIRPWGERSSRSSSASRRRRIRSSTTSARKVPTMHARRRGRLDGTPHVGFSESPFSA